ncbi:hypothetical protein GSY74_09665 [Sulfurovum sp. bin170]|uniref:hypothetical protein n=1 Tax=Sulfurovum sp. bin170 TaxID=2695268 RepID=UPI0013E0C291|nr:hypothetical protein [Sulfurovum sp. bin170]NEW61549.1 hypothetical protein [Sulfurovum sp. bin170]
MIQGIASFTAYFEDFRDDYIVIGGLATAMNMHDLGFTFRATKDIDLVIISKDNEAFLKKLLNYIEEAGYKTRQRTVNESRHNLFRFLGSDDREFPEQIELFAIHAEDSVMVTNQHIIPIQTPAYYSYLSAILLDRDYFALLVQHSSEIEGLHIASPEVLIPLKIHAYLNLSKEKSQDAKKHLKDIIKLSSLLDGETVVFLEGKPRVDMLEFMPILKEMEEDRIVQLLESIGVTNLSKEDILEVVVFTYGL